MEATPPRVGLNLLTPQKCRLRPYRRGLCEVVFIAPPTVQISLLFLCASDIVLGLMRQKGVKREP